MIAWHVCMLLHNENSSLLRWYTSEALPHFMQLTFNSTSLLQTHNFISLLKSSRTPSHVSSSGLLPSCSCIGLGAGRGSNITSNLSIHGNQFLTLPEIAEDLSVVGMGFKLFLLSLGMVLYIMVALDDSSKQRSNKHSYIQAECAIIILPVFTGFFFFFYLLRPLNNMNKVSLFKVTSLLNMTTRIWNKCTILAWSQHTYRAEHYLNDPHFARLIWLMQSDLWKCLYTPKMKCAHDPEQYYGVFTGKMQLTPPLLHPSFELDDPCPKMNLQECLYLDPQVEWGSPSASDPRAKNTGQRATNGTVLTSQSLSPWCDCRRLGSTWVSWRWQDINVGNPLWRRALFATLLWYVAYFYLYKAK